MVLQTVDAPNSFSTKDYFVDADATINEEMPAQRFEVELIEENGVTRLLTRSFTETAEQLEQLVQMGMVEGFDSQMNKLESLLQA